MPDSTIINCFPGYEIVTDERGIEHNMYRGTDVGHGGYIYSEPGMYSNVALLDVASMHPNSIINMNKLGDYTDRYTNLIKARIFIKHHDYESAKKLFDGKLDKYLTNDDDADALATALKYPANAFYGLCSATFENPARDSRDRNNIVALRGALFMRTLQDEIIAKGFRPISFRTDSVKIPDATPEIIQFVQDFAKEYGYEMEHECTYEKLCLVNDSAYVAKYDDKGIRNKGGKHAGEWTATAAEFQVPFVFKTLFSKEPIEFKDLCVTKEVTKGSLYLDYNENLPEDEHDYKFIGKIGLFCPIKAGEGGGLLYRCQDDKYYAAAGTKGYRWLEAEAVKNAQFEDKIDMDYFHTMVDSAVEHIKEFGDFEWFTSNEDMSWLYVKDNTPEEVEFTAMNKPE